MWQGPSARSLNSLCLSILSLKKENPSDQFSSILLDLQSLLYWATWWLANASCVRPESRITGFDWTRCAAVGTGQNDRQCDVKKFSAVVEKVLANLCYVFAVRLGGCTDKVTDNLQLCVY